MNRLKIILLSIFSAVFAVAVLIFGGLTILEYAALSFVYALGIHLVYASMFNTEIHMTGYTIPINQRKILRFFILASGVVIMVGVIIKVVL